MAIKAKEPSTTTKKKGTRTSVGSGRLPKSTSAHLPPEEQPRWASNFPPFAKGNTYGDSCGPRKKLTAAFVRGMLEEFEKNGQKAIQKVCKNDPATFLRLVANFAPREVEIKRSLDELSDDVLDAALIAVQSILAAQAAVGDLGEGETTSVLSESA